MNGKTAPTILVTWELGGGLGHLLPLVPLVKRFRAAGHRVYLVLRDLSRANRVFGGLDVCLLQAPIRTGRADHAVARPRTLAHILRSCGFGGFEELEAFAQAWRRLFEFIQPDLILFDHSPVALLAARAVPARRATIGTGFCCPPGEGPFPDWRTWLPNETETLQRDENAVLALANRVLESWRLSPLGRLSQLYGDVDECFLTTFRELDHYPQRRAARYWGMWSNRDGTTPVWPDLPGKRVFAYLKSFRALPDLLRLLNQMQVPSLVYIDRGEARLKRQYESKSLRFVSAPLNLELVGKHGDLAILNGGHGATATMLLAGCPILQIPLNLEQSLTGAAIARMGAGLSCSSKDAAEIGAKLVTLLRSKKYAQEASRFAARYCDFDPQLQAERIVDRVDELVREANRIHSKNAMPAADNGHASEAYCDSDARVAAPAVRAPKHVETRIVVGVGSGRCGTRSLARLLNRQPSTVVKHQSLPVLPWDTSAATHPMGERFGVLLNFYPQVARVGDVAFFYLPYVEKIFAEFPDTKVICLRRSRSETIESFVQWLAATRPGERINHWSADREAWDDDRWDICFPKYVGADLHTTLGAYWDDYYSRADDFARREPDRFRIFDFPATLADTARFSELLTWLGIPENQQQLAPVHVHSTEARQKRGT